MTMDHLFLVPLLKLMGTESGIACIVFRKKPKLSIDLTGLFYLMLTVRLYLALPRVPPTTI